MDVPHRPIASTLPAPDPLERRREPRFALTLAVTMNGDNNFYCGVSENLSESGIFIATVHELPIGTVLRVTFSVPTSAEPISVLGEVRWLRRSSAVAARGTVFGEEDGASVKPGFGVQFLALDEHASDAVRRFLRYRAPDLFEV
jgi:uncharacterized protein (TIGR02266 family)